MAVDHGTSDSKQSVAGAVAADPVAQAVLSIVAVSAVVILGNEGVGMDPSPIMAPIYDPWFGSVLSIYAHTDPGLLVVNATVVAIAGTIVSRSTASSKFHMFFVMSGTVSAILHVQSTGVVGPSLTGVGASGAALALVGYMFTGTVRPRGRLRKSPVLPVLGAVVGLALVTVFSQSVPDGVYVAHATGGVLGLVAGHYDILRAGN